MWIYFTMWEPFIIIYSKVLMNSYVNILYYMKTFQNHIFQGFAPFYKYCKSHQNRLWLKNSHSEKTTEYLLQELFQNSRENTSDGAYFSKLDQRFVLVKLIKEDCHMRFHQKFVKFFWSYL